MTMLELMGPVEAPVLKEALDEEGALCLRDVLDDTLLEVALSLGEIVRDESVEVVNGGAGKPDSFGNILLSSTNDAFRLHTDGYNRTERPHYLVLLRIDNGVELPVTYVADSREAFKTLDDSTLATLKTATFPYARGLTAVISENYFSFNLDEIERWSAEQKFGPALFAAQLAAAQRLSSALSAVANHLTLVGRSCLILDNHRVCHGRSALSAVSARKLRRVWIR
jgi:alpha-ketoglutarate-dependent taurine dioxygenase